MNLKCNQILTRSRVNSWAMLLALSLVFANSCQGKGYQTTPPQPEGASLSRQLSLLEESTAPAAVSAELWGRLASQLAAELEQRYTGQGNKLVSSAPNSDSSRANLSISNGTLNWNYFNQADYDQNGEVNLADLTLIALNYGEAGPFFVHSSLSVVDGDSNSEINLADITPIAVNFFNSALGG